MSKTIGSLYMLQICLMQVRSTGWCTSFLNLNIEFMTLILSLDIFHDNLPLKAKTRDQLFSSVSSGKSEILMYFEWKATNH